MTNHLPVPPELQHLIEKRENEDRRQSERRNDGDRRESDLGPVGCIESLEELDQLPLEDRRSDAQRREDAERRTEARREADTDHSDSVAPEPPSTDSRP